MYAARKGGTIVTCASTSGYMHEYDNRYLWMNLKRIIGSHFANYRESWEANRLIAKGMIHPTLSRTYPLDEVGQAALDVHRNLHQGKVGVLCLAPEEGLGVRDQEKRGPAPRRDQPRSAASEPGPVTGPRVHPGSPSPPASRGGSRSRAIGQTEPHTRAPGRRYRHMSDQGLSIFDDEPEDSEASTAPRRRRRPRCDPGRPGRRRASAASRPAQPAATTPSDAPRTQATAPAKAATAEPGGRPPSRAAARAHRQRARRRQPRPPHAGPPG